MATDIANILGQDIKLVRSDSHYKLSLRKGGASAMTGESMEVQRVRESLDSDEEDLEILLVDVIADEITVPGITKEGLTTERNRNDGIEIQGEEEKKNLTTRAIAGPGARGREEPHQKSDEMTTTGIAEVATEAGMQGLAINKAHYKPRHIAEKVVEDRDKSNPIRCEQPGTGLMKEETKPDTRYHLGLMVSRSQGLRRDMSVARHTGQERRHEIKEVMGDTDETLPMLDKQQGIRLMKCLGDPNRFIDMCKKHVKVQ